MRAMGRVATIAAFVLGVTTIAVVVLLALSRPGDDDPCTPGYEVCLAAAGGLIERLDCRIELLHCRRQGPGHWRRSRSGS